MTERDAARYILRFPPGMRERLHEEARANGRSLNAEIIMRLGGEPPERTMRQPKAVQAAHGSAQDRLQLAMQILPTIARQMMAEGLSLTGERATKRAAAEAFALADAMLAFEKEVTNG